MPGILADQSDKPPETTADAGGVHEKARCPVVGSLKTPPVAAAGSGSLSPISTRTPSPDAANSKESDSEPNLNGSSTSVSDPEPPTEDPAEAELPKEDKGASKVEDCTSKEEEKGGGEKEKKSDSVVYNIHLSLPGVSQAVDVLLTSRDTVHDLLQFALERPECCYRTALSVHYKGKRLDDFFEIGSIEGLKSGDTVEVVEESYTQRDARLHVERLKELLSTNPLQQSVLCKDGLTLSFLSSVASLDPEDGGVARMIEEIGDIEPPSHIMPRPLPMAAAEDGQSPTFPLSFLYPANLGKHFKFPECLKSLSYSSWNPPPSRRKMKGDLLYLDLTTLEGQEYFITATPLGFFLNKSVSQENFDPTPRKTPHLHRHLVGLLSQISPLFKKNFAQLQKFGETLHAFEIMPVPYPFSPWIAPEPEHKPASVRIDDTMSLRALPDEMILGQMRDWNEELQTARHLPTDTSSNKVFRDRALFKIHSDFVQACTRGAVAVVDGYLSPLNPGDEPKFRMYMWNSIFFSLAFNGHDHYKDFGGDNAAHVAAAADLQGVAAFERLEPKGLHTLGTVLVDYRGYRVVCQTIIPGLLQREHDSAVIYGSIDSGKNINMDEKFAEMMRKVAEELHIREHKVRTVQDKVVSLPSSLEIKGIIGNDHRSYALDLFRLFPPDSNYMEFPEGAKFRHKMAVLRPEFLDTFLSYKFVQFLRIIKEKTDSLKPKSDQAPAADASATSKTDTGSKTEAPDAATAGTANTVNKTEAPDAATTGTANTESTTETPGAATANATDTVNTTDTTDSATKTDETDSERVADSADPSPKTDPSISPPDPNTEHKPNSTTTITETDADNTTKSTPPNLDATPSVAASAHPGTDETPSSVTPPSADATPSVATPSSTTPPDSDATATKLSPFLTSVLCPVARPGVSILATPHSPPNPRLNPQSKEEGEELLTDRLFLLDARSLVEEKEVGPDIPQGLADEDLSAMRESEGEPKKHLPANQLDGHPMVTSAFREALKEAGSSSQDEFIIKFNVDILSPGVNHADTEEVVEQDRKLVREASQFLVESVVPRFVRDCIQLLVTPMDGDALTVAMHARGINMRYLGEVATLSALRPDLCHLRCLCLSEMVIRLAKRRLRLLLQETPIEMTSEAISHFLNCLLAEVKEEGAQLTNGHIKKKSKKKKGIVRGPKAAVYLKLTNEKLWRELVEEMESYYKYKLDHPNLTDLCAKTGISKLSLLRGVCRKTGVQILLRDYDFTTNPVITDDDIVSVFPVVKHTDFKPSEPAALYELALSKFGIGQLHVAHELFASCLQMFVQVYGPMHLDTANCYRHLARIEYILNDVTNALSNQHKATLILERVLGVDHPETITAYINLALHSNASNQPTAALRLLYRARYLILMVFGEDHPEMATCDSNIAIILHSVKDYKNSLLFLSNALNIHRKYHGDQSLQVAMTHHLFARVHSFMGDFRAAISHEKTTFSIYQAKFGGEHDKTKDSSQCLKELTSKAVTMQKTINEMTGRGSGERVLVDLPGSWGEVVGMMNPGGGMDLRQQQQLRSKPHVVRKKPRKGKAPSSPTSGQNQQ